MFIEKYCSLRPADPRTVVGYRLCFPRQYHISQVGGVTGKPMPIITGGAFQHSVWALRMCLRLSRIEAEHMVSSTQSKFSSSWYRYDMLRHSVIEHVTSASTRWHMMDRISGRGIKQTMLTDLYFPCLFRRMVWRTLTFVCVWILWIVVLRKDSASSRSCRRCHRQWRSFYLVS